MRLARVSPRAALRQLRAVPPHAPAVTGTVQLRCITATQIRQLNQSTGGSSHALKPLLENNAAWASETAQAQPEFFNKLAAGQAPHTLWIGCSDSRCPETTLLKASPGEVFVHRNIANVVSPTDLSSLAVVEFAVLHLKVKQIVVCGHSSCGGVAAALGNSRIGTIDRWLMPLRELRQRHAKELESLDDKERGLKLVELNVRRGVEVLRQNPDVIAARNERGLKVYGVIFDLGSGRLNALDTDEGDDTQKSRDDAFACA